MVEKYLITSAVNNSKIFEDGFSSLRKYAEINNASLIVIPITYNPMRLKREEIIYDDRIVDYIEENNFKIHDKVSVLSEINIRPTAIRPLTGLASMGDENHIIIAHPRLHLDSISSIKREKTKFLLTTGCITEPNYTFSKLGAKAQHHHSYGAAIVEVDTKADTVFIRQISIDNNGSFYDINKFYSPNTITDTNMFNGVSENYQELEDSEENGVSGIVFGDIHELHMSPVVREKGIFGKNSLLDICKPMYSIYHDLLDQFTESHHHTSPFTKYAVSQNKMSIVDEIDRSIKFLDDTIKKGVIPVVVSSNHNSHLLQWLERVDWKEHPTIAKDILKYNLLLLDKIDQKDADSKIPDLFKLIVDQVFGENVIALDYNQNFKLNSFELSLHGDKGINGARSLGNIQNHINTKLIVGHSHSAKRIDGVLTVGTSSKLDRNYTYGLSSWSHTHALIHKNNKAQLITQHPITGDFCIWEKPVSQGVLKNKFEEMSFTPHFVTNTQKLEGDKTLFNGVESEIKYIIREKGKQKKMYFTSIRHIAQHLNIGYGTAYKITKKQNQNYILCGLDEK